MKRWTRKLLAGLLSVGMLLQVASPLSALAAEGGTSGGPTLTIEMDDNALKIDESGSYDFHYSDYSGDHTVTIEVTRSGDTFILNGAIPYYTTITGTDSPNLVMDGGEGPIATSNLTITGIHDFTATTNSKAKRAFVGLNVECTGDVKITSPSTCTSGLTIKGANNVHLTSGGTSDDCSHAALQSANITCNENVTIENKNSAAVLSNEELYITTPGLVTLSCSGSGVMTGRYGRYGMSVITSGGLIMNNASGSFGDVNFTRPTGNTNSFIVSVGSSDGTMQAQSGIMADNFGINYIRADNYKKDYRNCLSILPGEYEEYGITLSVFGGSGVKVTNLNKDNVVLRGYYKNSILKYDKDTNTLTADEVFQAGNTTTIKGNGTSKLVLKQSSEKGLDIKDMAEINVDGDIGGYLKVSNCTGDVTINGSVSDYVLATVDGNVKIVGNSEKPLIDGGFVSDVTASSLLLENTSGGKLGKVTFTKPDSTKTYRVTTGKSSIDPDRTSVIMKDNSYTLSADSDISYLYIEPTDPETPPEPEVPAELEIIVNGKSYKFGKDAAHTTLNDDSGVMVTYFENGNYYKIDGGFNSAVTVSGTNNKTPNVKMENDNGQITSGTLTVTGVNDFTAESNVEIAGEELNIIADGDVNLSGMSFIKTVVKSKSLTMDTAKSLGDVTYTTPNGNTYTPTKEEADSTTLKLDASTVDGSSNPGNDDTPATTDSGFDSGGAVAAVLMGGAAVWGGYEIATRVILHNILPEGAAIPANRGQLALLVWNNAGRPEPAAQPAFADVADADMAKAAQWCVEQGIMEAKTAETFKPEGWMPKFKVIEVWNKAFPKQ